MHFILTTFNLIIPKQTQKAIIATVYLL